MRRLSQDTYAAVFGVAYLGLMTNALLVVAGLPVLAVLVLTDPAESLPLLALVAPLLAPALTAAFTVFGNHAETGSTEVVRGFVRGWWATARWALLLGAATSLALVVLVVDIQWLAGRDAGVLALPLLALLACLVAVGCVVGLVAIAEVPDARLRELVAAAVVLGVRRWYLSVASLVALASLAGFFLVKPALALGLAAAPVLYVVWANGRYTLRPAIRTDLLPQPADASGVAASDHVGN